MLDMQQIPGVEVIEYPMEDYNHPLHSNPNQAVYQQYIPQTAYHYQPEAANHDDD